MYEKRAFAGNPEEILFAHICNNKGTTLKAGANFCYSRGLEHDEQNITLHTNRRHNSSKSEVNNHCQQIIHLNPDDETGYLHLGIDLANSGKPKKALQYLNIALEKNPKNSKIWEVLGHIHLNTKKYKKALDAYEKAIELDPDEPDSREIKGDIWQNL
jgi:tetratricopeptide (TPR) repeat protein